ncbi:MAG: glycosyltransferase [Actinobacteria bacterium]|uniref:Unannotated protein n=1 Tax=freshwater metagenome TaxID=449393 RepID=A0A6J5ZB16_9ZZZZ|nr:glycosyltransferase [Actinomycetota bacterium]
MLTRNKPELSIIIPFYNAEEFLSRSIDSVIEHSNFADVELILVNDGSTDESPSIARKYSEEFEGITLVGQENCGIAAARNVGVETAQAQVLTFLDSDDDILSARFTHGLARTSRENPVVMGTMRIWARPGLDLPRHLKRSTEIPEAENFYIASAVIHRSVFDQGLMFNTLFDRAVDIEWWLRAQDAGVPMEQRVEAFTYRRIHGANVTFDAAVCSHWYRRAFLEHTQRLQGKR